MYRRAIVLGDVVEDRSVGRPKEMAACATVPFGNYKII